MNTAKQAKPIQLPPTIDIDWRRFPNDPAASLTDAINKPVAYVIYGGKDTGKSSFAENIAHRYDTVIDIFGSRDNEALGWCRSPKENVLFLKGRSVEIDSSWDAVNADEFKLSYLDKYDAIVSCCAFYSNLKEECIALSKLMNKLWMRTHWTKPTCLTIREAANLLYSRLAIGESQSEAKNYIVYVLREMRHCGFALALDSIRFYSLDIDVRAIADYTVVKAPGVEGLPDALRFLYQWYDPYGIMRMPKNRFVIVSRSGPLGDGTSTCPYWHKTEQEDILGKLDIRIKYSAPIDLGQKNSNVGDYEHMRIVMARHKSKVGTEKLGEMLGRSGKTVWKHIGLHNHTIEVLGECDKCARVKCLLSKTLLGMGERAGHNGTDSMLPRRIARSSDATDSANQAITTGYEA